MEEKQHKVRFSRGWDNQAQKYRYQTGVVVAYLQDEIIEVRKTRGGELVRLYKHEYQTIKT